MNKEIAVVVSNDNQCNVLDTIKAIKNADFKNVFVQWYDKDFDIEQLKQVELCRLQGFKIIFAHLGYQKINEIWLPEGDYFVDRYKKDILDCHNLGIDMVVMHPCSKWEAPAPNEIGLNRFRQIVEYAKSLNVKVSIENTKLKGYIEYLLDNINYDNLGVCFDAGHYHCNYKDDWDLSKFKDRIFCVHLHDNNGLEDQHLLPFDGNLDWKYVMNTLNKLNYDGPITMELCYRNQYLERSVDDFYLDGYKAGLKLSSII